MHIILINVAIVAMTLSSVASNSPPFKSLMWAPADTLNTKEVEPAGSTSLGNELIPVYVARGPVDKGGTSTGYITPEPGAIATLCTGGGQGVEIRPEVTQVMYAPKGTISWVPMTAGDGELTNVPKNVILGGQFPRTRENLYVCRANGAKLLPGFFLPSRRSCTIWDGDMEQQYKEFEILCVNDFGILSGAYQ